MIELPHPLHPAIVHFPIVLILLATVCSIVSLFTSGWSIRKWTAILFILAALAAWCAAWTGGKAAHEAGPLSPAIKPTLHEHAENGEDARNLAAAAAVFAIIAAALDSKKMGRIASFITAALAVGALFCVFQAGRLGGEMVYQHGLGTKKTAEAGPASPGR